MANPTTNQTSSKSKSPKPPFPPQDTKPPGKETQLDPRPRYLNKNYKGSEKLKDKIALISGGDSGIGRAVAVLFAREGADVAFTYMAEEKEDADVTLRAIEDEGQQGFAIEVNFEDPKDCYKVADKVKSKFGRLDILVNNAAFQNHIEFDELSFEQFEHTFKINIFAYFNMIKASVPLMKGGGNIINTGSVVGHEGKSRLIDYGATKGAIHNLTKSLAESLSDKKIRVNCVAPGPVWTPLNPAERSDKEIKDFGKKTLFGRPAQPEEIAPAYVYLASDITASYVTGETINLIGETSGAN